MAFVDSIAVDSSEEQLIETVPPELGTGRRRFYATAAFACVVAGVVALKSFGTTRVLTTKDIQGEITMLSSDYAVQAYCGGPPLESCSEVPSGLGQMAGAFAKNIQTRPPRAEGDAADNYLVLGGDNVGVNQPFPSNDDVYAWMQDANANNVDIDTEGIFDITVDQSVKINAAVKIANGIKQKSSDAKIRMTLVGSFETSIAEGVEGTFDSFGLMLYGNSMTGEGWGIPEGISIDNPSGETYGYIDKWLSSSVPNSKIVLGMTSTGLEGYMADFFKKLVAKYGLGGMFVWKVADMPFSASCLTSDKPCSSAGPGPSPSPSTCSDQCAHGPAKGSCCDSGDTNEINGQEVKCSDGQEACCGNTQEGVYWCQKKR